MTGTDTDLTARLQDEASLCDDHPQRSGEPELYREAADRIAELTNEIRGLRHDYSVAADHIAELEKRTKAATEALAEAQRWTMSGGDCSIHIERAEDLLAGRPTFD